MTGNPNVAQPPTVAELETLVARVRCGEAPPDALAPFLSERHRIYRGRSASAAVRLRGYLFASFADAGLPRVALPFIIEELDSGRDAYSVAGAARALRGLPHPDDSHAPILLNAVRNIRTHDDAVSLEEIAPSGHPTATTSALQEIFATLEWMGAAGSESLEQLNALRAELSGLGSSTLGALDRAIEAISDAPVPSCCIGTVESSAAPEMSLSGEPIPLLTTLTFERRPPGLTAPETVGDPPYDLVFQDQKGMCVTYRELLAGRPSVLTFFYTRCDNPNKCSRTITMFGRLVTAAYEAGLDDRFNALAVTYDPAFDTPSRMAAYGESRGVVYSDRVRMARTPVDFDRLSTYLQLGVSFGPSIVNRHRIEVYLLDAKGRVVGTIARRQWDVADVLPQLVELVRTAA